MTGEKIMTVKRVTPVLLADEIEPCIEFWTARLGYQKTTAVPDGDKLAFAALSKDGTEIMYQTRASAQKDAPHIEQASGSTNLYVEVDDFNATVAALKGVNVVLPERTTFYGSREIGVRDPAGHLVVFAYFNRSAQN